MYERREISINHKERGAKAISRKLAYVNGKPAPTSSNQSLHILPLRKMPSEISSRCPWQIPGAYLCVFTIDRLGRKPIQGMGFLVLTILFIIMGFAYDALNASVAGTRVFVFLYCLCNFFSNFGPNSTVGVTPGEAFPTRYRSTAHGISAASGKFGAVIAQVGFARLKDIGGENAFVKHMLVS